MSYYRDLTVIFIFLKTNSAWEVLTNCSDFRQSWALKTLQNHCRDQERHGDSYMLCQERANLTEYRLFVEGKEAFYRIVLVDNKYQVRTKYIWAILNVIKTLQLLWWNVELNSLCAKFFSKNINIHLQFLPFFHIDTTQVVEILPHGRQWPL